MKIISYAIIIILISTSLSWSQNGSKPKSIIGLNSSSRINNEYMVVFKDNVVDQLALTLSQTNNIKLKQAIETVVNDLCTELAQTAQGSVILTYTNALYGFALSSNSEQAVTNIVNDSRIEYIEVNLTASASTTQLNPTWGLDRIDQQNLPLDNSYTYDQNGTGVTVYVVDSGVFVNSVEFGGINGRASWGVNFINDGNGLNDCSDHGTHVAGTIASITYGVAKNAKIKAIRILDCFNGTNSSLITAGIDWVVADHVEPDPDVEPGPDVVSHPAVLNLSIESDKALSVNSAVNRAVEDGITVVSAAGNGNEDACNVSPANATGSITVGATTMSDARSFFSGSGASNFGPCVDLFAPGSNIVSLSQSGPNVTTNTFSGTSFAAPHVTGAAALYLQENPAATPAEVKQAIITNASTIMIGNAGTGSPNKILNITNLVAIPDAYEEDDDALSQNNVIGINSSSQSHNFSDDSLDWIQLTNSTLSNELNLTDGFCDNLTCGIELTNVSNFDLCLQFSKAGSNGQLSCGLSNGFYSDASLVTENSNGSQCDSRYALGWSHVKVIDNESQPESDKNYNIEFKCSYDEHVELPQPDIYEDDDTFEQKTLLPINGPYQIHNFNDDPNDWIELQGEDIPNSSSCISYNFCKVKFQNVVNADMCIEEATWTGTIGRGRKICDLSTNESFFIPTPFVSFEGGVCHYSFFSSNRYHLITEESGIQSNDKSYKVKLECSL